jgi:hypothetical protein
MAWPFKRPWGSDVDPSLVGSRQVPQNPATRVASPPIQVDRHARNGRPADVRYINALCEAANQGILYRGKEVFRMASGIGVDGSIIPLSAAGTRTRWRWAFHTGPYTHALMAIVVMHPQDSGFSENSSARIDIIDGAAATVGSATFNYGTGPTGTTVASGLSYLKVLQQYIEGVDPDTDYYGVVSDVDYGKIASCSIFELQSMGQNFSGYMPQNITEESSILDVYREKLSTIFYNLWRRGGATVFNYTCDPDTSVSTVTSATPKNLLDGNTTYGTTIAGYDLVMTGKSRLSQTTGVPVRLCAYMNVPAASTGVVNLRDSAGASVIQISQAGAFTGWVTTTGVINSGKHYITHHRSAGAGTVSTYAVSCYEYE